MEEGWIPALQAERDALKAEVARLTEALRKMEERAEQAEQNQWHEHEALERAERERAVLQERYDCNTAIMRARTEKMNEFERSARLAEERADKLEQERYNACLRAVTAEGFARLAEERMTKLIPRSAHELDHAAAADSCGAVLFFDTQELRNAFLAHFAALAALDQPPGPTCK